MLKYDVNKVALQKQNFSTGERDLEKRQDN